MDIVSRFINYVKVDTQSDANSKTIPSTVKQKDLAKILVKELKELGLNAFMDEYGYVYAKIDKTKDGHKAVGFIAHMDTSPDVSGTNVKPRIIKNYQGEVIKLNQDLSMCPKTSPDLNYVIGDDIVVTDGNTLLGADNKAGIAIIMDFAKEVITKNPPHGDIYLGFTPDEEIGRGADKFNLDYFKADFAYTIDGGCVGVINFENFNASSAKVTFIGKSMHPGSAKGKLINSQHLAFEFHNMLPKFLNPAFTEGYDGFNHLSEMSGNVELTHLHYIIRNHNYNLFKFQEEKFKRIKDYLNNKYGYEAVKLEIKESYLNMYEVLKDDFTSVEVAKKATLNLGINYYEIPIRGGTDGARLSFMGLPCPNLGTGGFNFHSRFEFLSINQMKQSVLILLEIIKLV
ncbi:MAG: peptidase T [Acholeplasmataceae bacterium]|jgi:tripeptide aminopeptidase|nr:peptidase T [Acholeplasmataceae bacterium]